MLAPLEEDCCEVIIEDVACTFSTPQTVIASPSRPQYFDFEIPWDVEAVHVRGFSTDKICATISVQEATCPVFDLLRNVKFIGKYQTFTTQSSIHVKRRDFQDFFIVIVVHPSDTECLPQGDEDMPSVGSGMERSKNVTIQVIPAALGLVYLIATLPVIAGHLLICIGIFIFVKYWKKCIRTRQGVTEDVLSERALLVAKEVATKRPRVFGG
ncbi:SID1 transmembrane family member 1-like [Ptychodera flava]|uniref:SID1 transmembrane family member 1-like n=1 Tax=Ptychodera flava TaxID=63121 RepID=UPI00396A76C7